MSLSPLPTKLDERLLTFLDCDGLSRMAQVSKYWQSLADPHLYYKINFATSDCCRTRDFLLTLISRPQLAAHIRIVALSSASEGVFENPGNHEWLNMSIGSIHEEIDKIYSFAARLNKSSPYYSVPWLSDILSDDRCLESAWVLIASLAVNVETIFVALMRSLETQLGLVMASSYPERFTKVRHLAICDRPPVDIPVNPGLEALLIENTEALQLRDIEPSTTSLRKFRLGNILAFQDNPIEHLCGNGKAPHLTRLMLRELPCNQSDWLQQIVTILRDHCPLLEYLEVAELYWTTDDGVESPPLPLPNLHQLNALTTLRIDLDHPVDSEDRSALIQPDKLLPPNLTTLELTEVEIGGLARDLQNDLNLHDSDTAMSTMPSR